jgi:hypothetical protein
MNYDMHNSISYEQVSEKKMYVGVMCMFFVKPFFSILRLFLDIKTKLIGTFYTSIKIWLSSQYW